MRRGDEGRMKKRRKRGREKERGHRKDEEK